MICPYMEKEISTDTDTQRGDKHEEKGRNQSDVAVNQGTPSTARS